jgi:hypothetical protein
MKIYFKLILVLALGLAINAITLAEKAFSGEGIIMEQVRYKVGSSKKEKGKIWVLDNKIKFEEETGQAAAIFDLNSGEMIQIDRQGRRYVAAKPDEYFKFIQDITSRMKSEMEKQLSQLPPDKRAQMEQMMKSQGMSLPGSSTKPKNLRLQKPGKEESIAGYKSVKYDVYEDGKLIEEIWTSSDVLDNEIDMKKMSNYLQKIKDISENAGGMAFNPEAQMVYKEVFESGFPMRTVEHESEDGTYIEEITKVSKANLNDSEFLAPTDYKKITLQEMMGQLGK